MQYNYHQVDELVRSLNLSVTASECHGVLCGLLSTATPISSDDWLHYMLDDTDGCLPDEGRQQGVQLYQQTYAELQSEDLHFQPFLPSDDDTINARVQELAQWCTGFLYGLAAAGIQDINNLEENAAEMIRDLTEISRVSFDENESTSEEAESDLMELVEYVRIGILSLFDELHTTNSPRIQ